MVRGLDDADGYPCGGRSIAECCDCGASLCELHTDECGLCRETYCSMGLLFHMDEPHTNPNVSQRGRVATKRSSSRRRRRVKIRKLSCGPSSAGLLAVLARGVPICGQWKDTPFPRLVVQRNWSRYFLPLSSAELQLATAGAPGGIAVCFRQACGTLVQKCKSEQ